MTKSSAKPSLKTSLMPSNLVSSPSKKKMQLLQQSQGSCRYRILNLILVSSSLCILYLLISLLLLNASKSSSYTSLLLTSSSSSSSLINIPPSTTIDHIVFGIASNSDTWHKRKDYVKLWWVPNRTRGCVFLEKNIPENRTNTGSLPPVCVSGDTNRFRYTCRKKGMRSAIRVARVVLETVALNHSDVRWFAFGDDDTVFFTENLVKTLSKYDHGLWHYIGTNSEIYMQNKDFSFDMAFGGAGFAISYPLAKVLAKGFDSCLERYHHLYGSDGRVQACIGELGISMTKEPGFHQMDVRGNIFGLLAAHPNTPLVTLHHLDHVDPIFPNTTTTKALERLIQASKIDPHRLLQQTVCYDQWYSWTISVSWGYAVQIFGNRVPLSDVIRPQKTFTPWKKGHAFAELYTIDTRENHPDTRENHVNPCVRPTIFFFHGAVGNLRGDKIESVYRRMDGDNCTFDRNSPKKLEEVRVVSRKMELDTKQLQAPRRHCCDALPFSAGKTLEIAIRECHDEELVYMHP